MTTPPPRDPLRDEEIRRYFERTLAGDPEIEPWTSWWRRNAGRLKKLMSPGAFLRLKWTPTKEIRELFASERRRGGSDSPGHGADPNAEFEDRLTPLMVAARGSAELVSRLLEAGAEVNGVWDDSAQSPLGHAAAAGNRETYELLAPLTEGEERERVTHSGIDEPR